MKENLKDKPVKFGEVLSTDEGDIQWLKNAAFNLRNTSGKTIVRVAVDIIFEATNNSTPFSHTMVRGVIDNQGKSDNSLSDTISVKLGDSIRFEISDDGYKGVLSFLQSLYGSDFKLKRVALAPKIIVFSDDTMWSYGFNFRHDPNNKDKWLIEEPATAALKKISFSTNTPSPRAECIPLSKISKISLSLLSSKKGAATANYFGCYYPTSLLLTSCGSSGLVNCAQATMNFSSTERGITIQHQFAHCFLPYYSYGSNTCWMLIPYSLRKCAIMRD